MSARQATRQRRHLRTSLGRKLAWRTRSGSVCERMRLIPASSPLARPTLMAVQRMCHLLRAPVRMGMGDLDQLRTSGNGLWSSMSLDQPLEMIELMRSQLKRALIMRGAPRLPLERPLLRAILFLQHFLFFCLFLGKDPCSYFFPAQGASNFWPGVLSTRISTFTRESRYFGHPLRSKSATD